MSEQKLSFVREENVAATPQSFWPALVMPGEEIDRESVRPASMRVSPGGRQEGSDRLMYWVYFILLGSATAATSHLFQAT
jgi:hypothetical protein